ncbi:MAG: hypothetical protein HZA77_11285 [Candidatus Schekmanbacteria bacterium]|nr:hypothetical protein [Candidatus Schekmanbacteria bacterium]
MMRKVLIASLSLFLVLTATSFGNAETKRILWGKTADISTLAGAGKLGFTDGKGTQARFNIPIRLAIDHDGTVIVSDIFNNSVRRITEDGNVTTVAGTLEGGYVDGPKEKARFGTPHGVAVDSKRNIYATDLVSSTIRKISPDGTVSTFAGSGEGGYRDGKGKEAMLKMPHAIAIDSEDNLIIADIGNNLIRKITPDGTVSTLAGGLEKGYRDGNAKEALFSMPIDVAVDGKGNVFVCDIGNNRIRKISNGTVSTIAGNGNKGYVDGKAEEAEFNGIHGIAIDKKGNLFIAELQNQVIRCLTPDGMVYTVAGSGEKGDKDGNQDTASMNEPGGLAIDYKTGTIYIADLYNHKVKKLIFTTK